MRRLERVVPCVFLVLFLALEGCSTTGPHRITLDRYSNAYPGMTVANFSMEDVDADVRYFATGRGYEIKFADSSQAFVRQELGSDSSLLWIAQKPGSPAILFMSSNTLLTVSIVSPSRPVAGSDIREMINVLYAILKDKFGEANVHLEDPGAAK